MNLYAKLNFKTSSVKAWNVFVSYSAIIMNVLYKYANASSPLL